MLGVVGRIIINDTDFSALKPRLEQARCFFPLGFNVGDVGDACFSKSVSIVEHALEDKSRDAVVGPFVLKCQTFDDHQGQVVIFGNFNTVFEGVVPMWTAGRSHPVQNVFTRRVGGAVDLDTS